MLIFTISNTVISVLLFGMIIGFTLLIIWGKNEFAKYLYGRKQRKSLQAEASMSNRTKHPDVNVFSYRGTFLRCGLAMSLAFVFMAFSWTSYDRQDFFLPDYDLDPEMEIIPPRTMDKPKPPPPPPPPVIDLVPDEIPVEELKFETTEIEPDDLVIAEPVVEKKVIAPPPPPIEPEEDYDEIIGFAEQMPLYPGCKTGSKVEKKKCSDTKLHQYLYKNLKYPSIARENGIEGRVYIQFVVEKDGTIANAKVVRDIGGGCGKSALDVVKSMNDLPDRWNPGKQRGRPVRVIYTLPVTFKLQG